MKSRLTIALVAGAIALAGAAGWYLKPMALAAVQPGAEQKATDKRPQKYVNLEKVIAMLRGRDGEPLSHYVAVDLVFKSAADKEKTTKEHLPLLRSIAVKALSAYTFEKAGTLTIDQLTADMNRAYNDSYARDNREMPFSEVLVGKFIIE